MNSYIAANMSITISQIQLTHPGSVYFIIVSFKQIVKNQITGHSDITIRPVIVPSVEQILNCLDGYG